MSKNDTRVGEIMMDVTDYNRKTLEATECIQCGSRVTETISNREFIFIKGVAAGPFCNVGCKEGWIADAKEKQE